MPKNLILVHLESISNTILWQYRVELKTIWKIMERSFVYNRFYTATTSTITSVTSLAHGTSVVSDPASTFGEIAEYSFKPNYFNNKANQLVTALFFHDYVGAGRLRTIWEVPDSPQMYYTAGETLIPRNQEEWYPLARQALVEHKVSGKPFYLNFIQGITHITYEDNVKAKAKSFTDRFRLGYLRLDSGVNKLLSLLSEFDLLSNSVVVFYGDHGDELWSHGLNGGWCHATTPYASLTWTPLFIYDADCEPGSTDQIASAIDLRETLVKRLIPDFEPEKCQINENWINSFGSSFSHSPQHSGFPKSGTLPPFKQTPFDGIDLAKETREYAFSQSLFALQLEFNDQAKALTKGYAVTDGTYRLTINSGGMDGRNGGMEFFCDIVDPTNNRNLLDFFRLDANGDIRDFYPPPEANSRSFELMFNPKAVECIKETFQRMKKALHEFIRGKEDLAMPFNNGVKHIMPEAAFKHALKRPYKD